MKSIGLNPLSLLLIIALIGAAATHAARAGGNPSTNTTMNKLIAAAKEKYINGNYSASIQDALTVYRFAQGHQNEHLLADAENLIGLIYEAQNQNAAAMSYFRRAAAINKRREDGRLLAANDLNISLVFANQKLLDSAVYYTSQSLRLSQADHIPNLVAMAKNHLGDYYFKQSKSNEAEKEFLAVLNAPAFQSDWENSFACSGMARLRLAQKKYKQAADFAQRAFTYARKDGAKWDAAQALDLAQQADSAMGDFRQAYQQLRLFKLYNDSLSSTEKDKEINRLLLAGKSFENERLLRQTQLDDQQNKIDRLIIAVISLLIVLLLFVFVYIGRRVVVANRTNQKLIATAAIAEDKSRLAEQQNADNNQLFSIIGHDLRSPFATLQNTLSLFRTGDLSAEEMLALVKGLEAQVSASAGMLDNLLLWAGSQLGGNNRRETTFDLVAKAEKVIAFLTPVANRKHIVIDHPAVQPVFVKGDADQIRIMIQNLVANAIKFTPVDGRVTVRYAKAEGFVDLLIEDNGIGMSSQAIDNLFSDTGTIHSTYGTDSEKGIGLGMQLVRNFASQNQVVLSVHSELGQGTAFTLRFAEAQN